MGKPPRLTQETIDRIMLLHSQGKLSTRKIGKLVGVSRDTVSRVTRGLAKAVGEKKPHPPVVEEQDESLPKPVNPESQAYNKLHKLSCTIEYQRCITCGGQVQVGVPCLLCSRRRMKAVEFDCYLNELLKVESAWPGQGKHQSQLRGTPHAAGAGTNGKTTPTTVKVATALPGLTISCTPATAKGSSQ